MSATSPRGPESSPWLTLNPVVRELSALRISSLLMPALRRDKLLGSNRSDVVLVIRRISSTSFVSRRTDSRTSSILSSVAVSYTHLRAHETDSYLVCRLLLEKKKK